MNFNMVVFFSCEDGKFEWRSVDGEVTLPLDTPKDLGKAKWREFIKSYDLCITGEVNFNEIVFTFLLYLFNTFHNNNRNFLETNDILFR